jgi:hypothetical protein
LGLGDRISIYKTLKRMTILWADTLLKEHYRCHVKTNESGEEGRLRQKLKEIMGLK